MSNKDKLRMVAVYLLLALVMKILPENSIYAKAIGEAFDRDKEIAK